MQPERERFGKPEITKCFLTSALLMFLVSVVVGEKMSREKLVEKLLKDYEKHFPPDFESDTPTKVDVQIFVSNVHSISETDMDYSVTIFLRQFWIDHRLNYTHLSDQEKLEIDSSLIAKFWVPDLFFSNEKSGRFHDITLPNRMLLIFRNGTISYSIRLSLTLECYMKLEKYPLDKQKCPLMIESYSYSSDNVYFQWVNETPIIINKEELEMAQYTLTDTKSAGCSKDYGEGNFSCIKADFYLQRNMGYYLIQVYIPSVLIVLLSWISFWLDVDSIPARISLGVLTILTMTTQSSGARASLPRVSYVKAIDVWMAVCLFFVFASLIEFAYINVLTRRKPCKRTLLQQLAICFVTCRTQFDEPAPKVNGIEADRINEKKERHPSGRQAARMVDRICRYVFPLVFFIFNVIYWCVYLL